MRPGDWGKARGELVPRWRRNSHRIYDAEGREIEPATIANPKENGIGLRAYRERCNYRASPPFDGIPDTASVPDSGLRLWCSGCGA